MKTRIFAKRSLQVALSLAFIAFAPQTHAMDLFAAYEQALSHDPNSLAANDALRAGREKAIQGDALLRPQVSLQASVDRMNTHSSADSSAQVPSDGSGTVRQGGLVLTQPLYDKGATTGKQQLHDQSTLAQFEFGQTRQDLILRVAQAYFGVVAAEERLRVVGAEKAALRQQRDRAQARFEVGQGKVTDLQESQARLDSVESREIVAQSDLEWQRSRFSEIVGASPEHIDQLAPLFTARLPQPDNLNTWQSTAEAQNYSIKSKQTELDIATVDIDRYRASGRPTLALVARYGAQGQTGSLAPWIAPSNGRSGSVGVQLNIPFDSGGGISSRERESVARKSLAEQLLAATQRDVRLQVQEQFLAVRSGVSRIAALEQALASARTALASTTLGRDVGNRTQLDVLDAQQRVFAGELDLVQARLDYLMARLKLDAASGQLNEESVRSTQAWFASR